MKPISQTDAAYRRRLTVPRRGAMMPLIAVMLPMLLIVAAYAINIAHIESINTEIQCTADAVARAAGRVYASTNDKAQALVAAQRAANENRIGDYVLPVSAADLEFGISSRESGGQRYSFRPADKGNAVRVSTRTLAGGTGPALSSALPIFGLNNEIRPLRVAVSSQGDIDVVLVVDRSGSMAYAADELAQFPPAPQTAPIDWQFGDPVPRNARWLDLVESVKIFNGELTASAQDERLAMTAYNHAANTLVELTENYGQVIGPLNQISINFEAGGTNIGGGLLAGLQSVTAAGRARTHTAKVIVLMTDGVHNEGTSPRAAARQVAQAGVSLFAITFSDEADQAEMQQVARSCGGEHFHAATGFQLQQAFQEIAKRLPSLLTQ